MRYDIQESPITEILAAPLSLYTSVHGIERARVYRCYLN